MPSLRSRLFTHQNRYHVRTVITHPSLYLLSRRTRDLVAVARHASHQRFPFIPTVAHHACSFCLLHDFIVTFTLTQASDHRISSLTLLAKGSRESER